MPFLLSSRAVRRRACAFVFSLGALASIVYPAEFDFNRQIRPIFSEKCYACHGPDEHKRKAGLRLDRQESAFSELKSGHRAVVPRKLEESASLLISLRTIRTKKCHRRIRANLSTAAEIELIKRWIKSGAEWKKHWAYIAPERPSLPEVKEKCGRATKSIIFTLAKLEEQGIKPIAGSGQSRL